MFIFIERYRQNYRHAIYYAYAQLTTRRKYNPPWAAAHRELKQNTRGIFIIVL